MIYKKLSNPIWFNSEVHNISNKKKIMMIWELVINRTEYKKFLVDGIKMIKENESRKNLGK